MKKTCPKQYLSINGKTILGYSAEALLSDPYTTHVVIVVIPTDTHFTSLSLSKHPKVDFIESGVKRACSAADIRSISQENKQQFMILLVRIFVKKT